MFNVKRRLYLIFMLWTLIFANTYVIAYADPDSQTLYNTELETTASSSGLTDTSADEALDQDSSRNLLTTLFGTGVWSGTNVAAGVALARPFVVVIMTLSIAVVVLVCFLFFGVTGLDLAYITVPILRPLLMRGKENMSSMGSRDSVGKFCCISDSAVEAVEGKSGGRMGGMGGMGGGDRGVVSCLVKYISSRTLEFVAFIMFVIFFFTGILGNIVVMLFNLLYSIIQALMSLAPAA